MYYLSCVFSNIPVCLFLQILVVIEPLLIDEDYYARVEGREIISNLAKVRWLTVNSKYHLWLITASQQLSN